MKFFFNENVPKCSRKGNWERNYIQTAYYPVTENDSKYMFSMAYKDSYNQFRGEKSKLENSMFMTFVFKK